MKTETHHYLLELQERASAELFIFKIVHAMRPGTFPASQYRAEYRRHRIALALGGRRIVW